MKHGKFIRGNDHWLISSFKLMLDGFGFEWIVVFFRHLLHGHSLIPDSLQAPREAEAILSAMSADRNPFCIDAILTDDSNSFVFGASIVLRMYAHDSLFILIYPTHCHDRRSKDNENYEASWYSASDITTMLGITREDLILLASLSGGDYLASFQYYSDKLDLRFYPRTDYMGADLDAGILTSAIEAASGRRDPGPGREAAIALWLTTRLPKVRAWRTPDNPFGG
jgi:5'-3' exonuclease